MEPEGNQNFEKLETKIDNIYLDMIPNGGVIHQTIMSVNNLG